MWCQRCCGKYRNVHYPLSHHFVRLTMIQRSISQGSTLKIKHFLQFMWQLWPCVFYTVCPVAAQPSYWLVWGVFWKVKSHLVLWQVTSWRIQERSSLCVALIPLLMPTYVSLHATPSTHMQCSWPKRGKPLHRSMAQAMTTLWLLVTI